MAAPVHFLIFIIVPNKVHHATTHGLSAAIIPNQETQLTISFRRHNPPRLPHGSAASTLDSCLAPPNRETFSATRPTSPSSWSLSNRRPRNQAPPVQTKLPREALHSRQCQQNSTHRQHDHPSTPSHRQSLRPHPRTRQSAYLHASIRKSAHNIILALPGKKKKGATLTRRSAPALELNLVAVTTLRFLGSTAPTATSGVSTTATNLGGAVKIAARPNSTENPFAPLGVEVVEAARLPAGVPDRVSVGLWANDALPRDARPPTLVFRLNRPLALPATLPPATDAPPVGGIRAIEWRGRPVARLRLAERSGDWEMALGGELAVGVGDGFPSSSSCHCR